MGTRKSCADFFRTPVLVRRRNAMIYRASTLKSVPFGSDSIDLRKNQSSLTPLKHLPTGSGSNEQNPGPPTWRDPGFVRCYC